MQDRRRATWITLLLLSTATLPGAVEAAPSADRGGMVIYREQCLRCHGSAGEGTDEYPRPLAGDRSTAQLAKLIAETMPEDDPGTCAGDDAVKVAAYIHEAFYSQAARARAEPPRVGLARLTVRQYRNAVADLVASFRTPGVPDARRGLRGQYFKSRRLRDGDRLIERIDPEVRFDFGVSAPGPGEFDADKFSARWEGSVLAPETGEYTFTIRSEGAARLWVNGAKRPLIDAWVKSVGDLEHGASVFLLGGRAYPLRLEFTKGKAKDDLMDEKAKPQPRAATITLRWKAPHRLDEVIPAAHLTPGPSPETFVVATPFPPDDRNAGYERGTSISQDWDRATTASAVEVAGHVIDGLRELAGVGKDAPDAETPLRAFCARFAERAFRRPLTDEQRDVYVDRQFAASGDLEAAVKRSVMLTLKSPLFLYREVGGPDAYDVASRISFGLWDSSPDRELLDAAASGRLADRGQVTSQIERMVPDARTRAKLREFFLDWLKVDQVPDLSKDPARFPGFDAAIVSDLRTSLQLFLDDVTWGDSPDFRRLLLSDELYLNGRLARFYDADLPDDAPFRKMVPEPGERAGVLTHPYLMATFAYTSTSSPIHRGVFVTRGVLGRALRPPPQAVAPLAPDLHAGLSTRERVSLQTSPASCMTCHGTINPLGFGLEHFDAVGRYRREERGRPIDATGTYEPPSGGPAEFAGARGLATLLAESEEVHTAFVSRLFHHLVKQPIDALGPGKLPELRAAFAARDFHIRSLMVEIVAESALSDSRKGPVARATDGLEELPADVFQCLVPED